MKIKPFMILALTLTASISFADTAIFTCSTPGDALGAVQVISKSNGTSIVSISDNSDNPAREYIIASGLKDLKAGNSTTIVAQKSSGKSFGGGRSDAVLFRVTAGQKTGFLAENGNVYSLNCSL